jgi:hypothetical protein
MRPRPCVGEYTHLDPTLDRDIMDRITHIPVRAGSAVFWDNRIPHGNSYRNDPIPTRDDDDVAHSANALGGSGARAVVYCSFLPDVEVNRRFASRQLVDWALRRAPRVGDRWIRRDDDDDDDEGKTVDGGMMLDGTDTQTLTDLGKRLLGLAEWS